jgi:hypothetical protein
VVHSAWWCTALGGAQRLVVHSAWWCTALGGAQRLVVHSAWWCTALGGAQRLVVHSAWWCTALGAADEILSSHVSGRIALTVCKVCEAKGRRQHSHLDAVVLVGQNQAHRTAVDLRKPMCPCHVIMCQVPAVHVPFVSFC